MYTFYAYIVAAGRYTSIQLSDRRKAKRWIRKGLNDRHVWQDKKELWLVWCGYPFPSEKFIQFPR